MVVIGVERPPMSSFQSGSGYSSTRNSSLGLLPAGWLRSALAQLAMSPRPASRLQVDWLHIFQTWSGPERLLALDELIDRCETSQVKHMMQVIEPQFQRDFISLLPKELALYVLTFLAPRDLLQAAQTCRYWRILAEDNLLWREKCREEGVSEYALARRRKCERPGVAVSPWKSAYIRQHRIENNWRKGDTAEPMVRTAAALTPPLASDIKALSNLCTSLTHGDLVVSGSDDNTLKVWSAVSGKVRLGHDYMVKVWDPETEVCLHTLQGHTNRVYSLQFDGVFVVSGSLDTSIRVWDAETGGCVHTLTGHQSLTSGMELRDNILVSGNADSTVRVWDVRTGQCLHTLQGPNKHQSAVTCLQFCRGLVLSSSDDGTVKLWDLRTGAWLRDVVALQSRGSGGVVWRIRASDTRLVCAAGSRNGTEETKLLVLDFDLDDRKTETETETETE
ncbi:F-box/WD repeat-containing protein 7-like [Perca fluviatilis]|nr:F-box/WD repeat-containing protein 7-like [Perca fluviatilis]